jgi:hypothetical protein
LFDNIAVTISYSVWPMEISQHRRTVRDNDYYVTRLYTKQFMPIKHSGQAFRICHFVLCSAQCAAVVEFKALNLRRCLKLDVFLLAVKRHHFKSSLLHMQVHQTLMLQQIGNLIVTVTYSQTWRSL